MTDLSTLSGRLLTQELGDADSTVLFTDARREAAVNDGVQEFADLTECYIKQSTITVTGGTAEYDLNSTTLLPAGDFVRVAKQGVEFWYIDASSNLTQLSGDDLPRRDIEWLNRFEPGWRESSVTSSVQQTPVCYYERADSGAHYLGFMPTPCTGSSASASAVVPYVAFPPVLTASTHVPFNGRADLKPYHMAAVHFAAHQLEKLRRDDAASDRQLGKFMGYVTRYLQALRPKGGQHITAARSYWRKTMGLGDRPKDPRT